MSQFNSALEPNSASTDADARERLILALLRESRLDQAASAAGMSLSMAHRLKRTPEFEREFRKARNEAFGDAMAYLQWASGIAVAEVIAILRGPTTSTRDRLRAADLLLTHAREGRMEELDAVLEHVEKLRDTNGRRKGKWRSDRMR
jgi:hypothetical protein